MLIFLVHSAVWPGFAPPAKTVVQTSPGHDAITLSKKQGDSFSLLFSLFPNTFLFPFPVPPGIVGKEPR